ncbi:hypothetical protein ACF0H5_009808 [Mactra antiquata]
MWLVYKGTQFNLYKGTITTTTMLFLWTFVVMTITVANSMNEQKLWRLPPPMKGFQWEKALGKWYYQFRKAPCSWSSSNEFTDFEAIISKPGKNSLLFALTMRYWFQWYVRACSWRLQDICHSLWLYKNVCTW